MNIVFLLIGIVTGFVVGYFYMRTKHTSYSNAISFEKHTEIEKECAILSDRLTILKEEKDRIERELILEREKLLSANTRLAKAEEAFINQQKNITEQEKKITDLQEKFKNDFELIANKILDDKSKKFTEQNKANLDVILNPFKEKIQNFEKKVEEVYDKELRDKISLREEVKKLYDLNNKISEEANNLTKALKGDNKKQGNWGELILEKILERSGLVKGREYQIQFDTNNQEGERIKPDVVIFLPDKKHLVIDSKVSLVAYESYVNSEDEEHKQKALKSHLESVKSHIKLLSEKNYQTSKDFNTPDFVLLFVPIESSFAIAVQTDHDLFNYAWDRQIVIVSPSTLLATLRTIASIWKQDRQAKNVLTIAEESGKLYDKFVGFLTDLESIGAKISATQKAYEDAHKKLYSGSGNVITKIEQLKKLGAKASKQIDSKKLEDSD